MTSSSLTTVCLSVYHLVRLGVGRLRRRREGLWRCRGCVWVFQEEILRLNHIHPSVLSHSESGPPHHHHFIPLHQGNFFFFLPRIMPHIDCHSLSLDIILLEGRHQPGFMQYIGVHVHNNAPITCLFFSFPQMQCTSSLGYCASPYWSRSKCLMHHFNMYN